MASHPTVLGDLDLMRLFKKLKEQSLKINTTHIISLLKRRQISGPEHCALATAHVLHRVVTDSETTKIESLLRDVARAGRSLADAQPRELVILNITRRVLKIICDEAKEERADDATGRGPSASRASDGSSDDNGSTPPSQATSSQTDSPTPTKINQARAQPLSARSLPHWSTVPLRKPKYSSRLAVVSERTLFHLLDGPSSSPPPPLLSPGFDLTGFLAPFAGRSKGTYSPLVMAKSWAGDGDRDTMQSLKTEVIDCIQELEEEITSAAEFIAGTAHVPICPGDAVLLFQPSATVRRFILRVASKRKFTVYIAGPPAAPPRLRSPTDAEPTASSQATFTRKLTAAGITVVVLRTTSVMAYMPRITRCVLDARAVAADGGFLADAGAGAVVRAARIHGRPVIVLVGVYRLSTQTPSHADEWVEPGGGLGSEPGSVGFADGALVGRVRVIRPTTEWVDGGLVDVYITNLGMHSRDQLRGVIAETYLEDGELLEEELGVN